MRIMLVLLDSGDVVYRELECCTVFVGQQSLDCDCLSSSLEPLAKARH